MNCPNCKGKMFFQKTSKNPFDATFNLWWCMNDNCINQGYPYYACDRCFGLNDVITIDGMNFCSICRSMILEAC